MHQDQHLLDICAQFKIKDSVSQIHPYGSGHINDTYLVRTRSNESPNYILQRINHEVFKDIPKLMDNITRVTQHVQNKLILENDLNPARHCLTLIQTIEGQYYFQENDAHQNPTNAWRMYIFIEDTNYYDVVETPDIAYEGGKAFGRFQRLLADLPKPPLNETIQDFHNIDMRLQAFEDVLARDVVNRALEVKPYIDFVHKHQASMRTILALGQSGQIPSRVTHNDTKFNNVLLSKDNRALCVIDLDTVMQGYIQYDFSDTVRTGCNTALEDEQNLDKVSIDLKLFEGFSHGFLTEALPALNDIEVAHLAPCANLLPFMIGLRFLTDYLDGDNYFKIRFNDHNLRRTKVQFKLVESIEHKQDSMCQIIEQIVKTIRG